MKFKTIQIDCKGLSEKDLNLELKEKLGFCDWYGMNWDAMIDCLSYLREPEAKMTTVSLEDDEILMINCNHFRSANFDIAIFFDVIEAVNAI